MMLMRIDDGAIKNSPSLLADGLNENSFLDYHLTPLKWIIFQFNDTQKLLSISSSPSFTFAFVSLPRCLFARLDGESL